MFVYPDGVGVDVGVGVGNDRYPVEVSVPTDIYYLGGGYRLASVHRTFEGSKQTHTSLFIS